MRDKNTVAGLSMLTIAIVLLMVFAMNGAFSGSQQAADAYVSDVSIHNSAPGVNDDIDLGYLPGYIWVDQSGGAIYVAESVADGAAVWTDVTAGGSTFNAEEIDALVAANVNVLDFGLGFDLTESPAGEVNIVLDLTEDQIVTGEITDGTILEADLAAVDAAVDEECLTYEATVGDFEWQACGAGGGDPVDVEEGDVGVTTDASVLDFGNGFDLTESPAGEVNISLDYAEDAVDLATGDVTGILNPGKGGTGQSAATADGLLVGTGTVFAVQTLPDCDATNGALNFDATTDAWSCRNSFSFQSADIDDGTILEADLAAVDAAVDEECLTYEATGGDFEWQTCGAGGGGQSVVDYRKAGSRISHQITSGAFSGNTTLTADTMLAYPLLIGAGGLGIDEWWTYVNGTSAGSLRLCIYDDSSHYPGSLVRDGGTVSTSTGGNKLVAMTSTSLTADTLYWLVWWSDAAPQLLNQSQGALAVLGETTGGNQISGYSVSSTFGSCPASFPGSAANYTGGVLWAGVVEEN